MVIGGLTSAYVTDYRRAVEGIRTTDNRYPQERVHRGLERPSDSLSARSGDGVDGGLCRCSWIPHSALASARILSSGAAHDRAYTLRPRSRRPVAIIGKRCVCPRTKLAAEMDKGRVRRPTGCFRRTEQYDVGAPSFQPNRSSIYQGELTSSSFFTLLLLPALPPTPISVTIRFYNNHTPRPT